MNTMPLLESVYIRFGILDGFFPNLFLLCLRFLVEFRPDSVAEVHNHEIFRPVDEFLAGLERSVARHSDIQAFDGQGPLGRATRLTVATRLTATTNYKR